VTSDGYSHLCFYYRTSNIQRFQYNNPMSQFNTAIQIQHVFHLHTLHKSVGVASPQHAANISGGEFRSRSLQVYTASLGVTRSRDGSILLSDLVNQTKKRCVYYVQSHLPKHAVGGHVSCAEDRIIVSAWALTLARSS
jgi:hypothetical protein